MIIRYMQTDVSRLWSNRIVTFAISALAAASVAYWALKDWARPAALIAPIAAQQPTPANFHVVTLALGGGVPVAALANVAPTATRYGLIGVVAGGTRPGAALISVDGQEAKPVRVGTLVDNDMVLESVNGRQAVLISSAGAAPKIILDMPKQSE